MGVIVMKDSSSGGEGDGWDGSGPSGGNSNAPDGVPTPGSDGIPGVVIGRKDGEIIIVFPDPGTAGPGLGAPTDSSASGNSPADALMAGGFVANYGVVNQPSVVIDVGSVTSTETANNSELVEENSSDSIINLIDDDSAILSLAEIEISDRPCPLPVFNLSFESNLDLAGPYYNKDASADAISGGNAAADPGTEDETVIDVEVARERVEWAESVAETIDKIIDFDKNIVTEETISIIGAKWEVTNIGVLDDLMTSMLVSQRETDFGYFITESNYEGFAQTNPGGPDAEELVRLYDVASYVENGLSSSVYAYNSNVDNEKDITSLELIDQVGAGYSTYDTNTFQQKFY